MKVVQPIAVTGSALVSSSIPEPDSSVGEVAWSASTAYSLGQRAVRTSTHRVYERLSAGTTAAAPESDSTNWLDVGPTNRWACFDNQVSTASSGSSPLTVTLAPGNCNSLALLSVTGNSVDVEVRDGTGGTVVYTASKSLDGTVIADWYQYVWEPAATLNEVVLTDLPPYPNAQIKVTITGSVISLGGLVVGTVYDLGDTKLGARVGIVDFSVKNTDAFGTTTFVRRAYSKRMDADMLLPMAQLTKVQRVLAGVRALPCVWIGSELPEHAPLVVFGFYKDFTLTLSYPKQVLCSLQVEGLT